MIPAPKLDDRTYADIVAEAMRLIPRYCPDWTNHNPSDPGITILELTAWMTELILYRLNRVPEKNYLAFLNMIGIRLRSPQPARALITFDLVEGAEKQVIKEGTQIATAQAADEDTIIFETQNELVVVGAPLDRCFSLLQRDLRRQLALPARRAARGLRGFRRRRSHRSLLVPRRSALESGDGHRSLLKLHLTAPDHGGRDLAAPARVGILERPALARAAQSCRSRSSAARSSSSARRIHASTQVNGIDDFWVRGRLAEVPQNPWETEIDTVEGDHRGRRRRRRCPTWRSPTSTAACSSRSTSARTSSRSAQQPKIDQLPLLWRRARSCRSRTPKCASRSCSPTPNVRAAAGCVRDLVLSWEYFDGKKWRILGKSSAKGAIRGRKIRGPSSTPRTAFTQTGVVTFRVPNDMHAGEVNGEDNFWVRARVENGDYGLPGSYMLDGDKWVWRDDRPLRPPAFKSIGSEVPRRPRIT